MSRIRIEDLPLPREIQESDCSAKIYGGARSTRTYLRRPYTWTQIAGPSVVLSNPFSAVTTFVSVAPASTRYSFSLFVDSWRR